MVSTQITAWVGDISHAYVLFSSSFDANAGLFEQILGPEDAVISDSLNHASIIDGTVQVTTYCQCVLSMRVVNANFPETVHSPFIISYNIILSII